MDHDQNIHKMGIYSLPGMQNLVWYRLMRSCFGWHHTFQHCLVIFKLNKVAKHLLNLAKSINQHEWNWTQDSIASVFSHHVFSSATETWDRYGNVLPRNILLATLLCLGSYEQCCTQLLKVLYKCCNTDMLRVLLIYLHSPLCAACPGESCVYISQTPRHHVTI